MISVDPAELTRQILAGFKPPPRLQLSQYADEFAVMTGNAAEKGRWNTLPYQREILDSFTNPAVETVAIMKSARVGWTKMLGVVVQYYSHQDPCPVMIVQPVKEDAEGYSKEEIKPLFEDTPVLRGLISESKSRGTASNTILLKQLGNGGLIDIVNAASGRSFRRKSRKLKNGPPSSSARARLRWARCGCPVRMSRRSTRPCRTTDPTSPGIPMSRRQLRRRIHRALVPIAAVPLIITALSGSIYGLMLANDIDAFWLLKIHTGNFGVLNLQPYYSAIIGILTLMIAFSGVGLMFGGRRKQPTSRSPEAKDQEP